MLILKRRYKELKERALSNDFTKDYANESMIPSELIKVVVKACKEQKREEELADEFGALIMDYCIEVKTKINIDEDFK